MGREFSFLIEKYHDPKRKTLFEIDRAVTDIDWNQSLIDKCEAFDPIYRKYLPTLQN